MGKDGIGEQGYKIKKCQHTKLYVLKLTNKRHIMEIV